ncbi:MAG: butyrate kinase [Thermoguttaceae bacterium]
MSRRTEKVVIDLPVKKKVAKRAQSAGSANEKKREQVIVVNPGGITTKLAVFCGEKCFSQATINHPKSELTQFARILDQYEYRLDMVLKFLADHSIDYDRCMAVVGRGGLMKPLIGGVYLINKRMLRDLESTRYGEHACNLGAPLAYNIAKRCGAPAFVSDPVTVDEFWPFSRYGGHPAFERKSCLHAISHRAAARRAAGELGVAYEKANFVVVHMGSGISIAAHRKGRIVDANNALAGDGPFSPERTGTVPTGPLVKTCFNGSSFTDVWTMLTTHGGLYAYLGTNDCREVEARIKRGDAKAEEVYEAMAYQIAKSIGGTAAVLSGQVNAVVLTGAMARSRILVRTIRKYAGFVAPFHVYPDIEEVSAMASAINAAMAGKVKIQEYR